MDRDELKVIIFPDATKRKWEKSKHSLSKDYFYNAVVKTDYSFRQIAVKIGVKTESQIKVFIQILEVTNTYSKIFAPYRNAIRIIVKDCVRNARSKVHLIK